MAKKSLPSTEFARFAALPKGEIRDHAIKIFVKSQATWSYEPTRSCLSEILRDQTRFNLPIADAPWDVVQASILAKCSKIEIQREQNCLKAKALFDFWRHEGWTSIRNTDLPPGMINPSQGYTRFWDDRFCVISETKLFVPFIDFRSSKTGLNTDAREVVFSVQDWLIRQSLPELEDLILSVIRFEGTKETGFTVVPYFHTGTVRWSPDQLTEMMIEVYADWVRVATEHEQTNRRTGTNDGRNFELDL